MVNVGPVKGKMFKEMLKRKLVTVNDKVNPYRSLLFED